MEFLIQFSSTVALAQRLREAAEAHHEYEQTLDKPDPSWPEWYAAYMARPKPVTGPVVTSAQAQALFDAKMAQAVTELEYENMPSAEKGYI